MCLFKRLLALAAACLFLSAPAFAQTNPGFLSGTPLSAAALNAAFAGKQDYTGSGYSNSLLWATDNAYDIGASGVNRPRNVYVAGFGIISGSLTVGGSATFSSTGAFAGALSAPSLTLSSTPLPLASGGTGLAAAPLAPTQQIFLSGSGTYTTPAGVKWIRVRMAGGGGGGGGGSTSATAGGTGGNTTFGSSFLVANGGAGGNGGGAGGGTPAGGSVSIGAGATGLGQTGGSGNGGFQSVTASAYFSGAPGGVNLLGGNGGGGPINGNGGAGIPNTGGGGGGGSSGSAGAAGQGGAAGGYLDAIITSVSASYSYSVGSGGTAGGGTYTGGLGGSGLIIVEEHYWY